MAPITITVSPAGYNNRGQVFAAAVDGRTIVSRSATPPLDAARVLLSEDVDPTTRLVMRHAGADHDALRSTVGFAAKLTVKDASHGPSIFASYAPWSGPASALGSPSKRENEAPATHPRSGQLENSPAGFLR
jgi:hypothetical protein